LREDPIMKPEGLTYRAEFVSREEERDLVARVEQLPFEDVRMHGVVARRKTIHFGWDYDYEGWAISPADPPPDFLRPLIARCAEVAGLAPEALAQVMVARYPPGAAIGWHRDAPMLAPPSSASRSPRRASCASGKARFATGKRTRSSSSPAPSTSSTAPRALSGSMESR
jgi:hypothetical protein